MSFKLFFKFLLTLFGMFLTFVVGLSYVSMFLSEPNSLINLFGLIIAFGLVLILYWLINVFISLINVLKGENDA